MINFWVKIFTVKLVFFRKFLGVYRTWIYRPVLTGNRIIWSGPRHGLRSVTSVVVGFYQWVVFMKAFFNRKMHSYFVQVFINRGYHIRLQYLGYFDRCRVAQLEWPIFRVLKTKTYFYSNSTFFMKLCGYRPNH